MNDLIHFLRETPDIDSSTISYKARFKGDVGKWFLDIQGAATLKYLNHLKCKTILYVGGGHGQNIPELLKSDIMLTVHGSSPKCKDLVMPYIEGSEITFFVSDLKKLPFNDKCFDAVIAYRMLTHLKGWKEFVKEISRVSSKAVIVDFPTLNSVNFFSSMLFFLKKRVEKNTRPYTIFKENEVKREFEKNHCMPFRKKPQFFIPMAFHRALKYVKISRILELLFKTLGITYLFGSPVIYCFKKDES